MKQLKAVGVGSFSGSSPAATAAASAAAIRSGFLSHVVCLFALLMPFSLLQMGIQGWNWGSWPSSYW